MRLHQMKTGTSNARWQGYRALGVAGAWMGSGHAQDMNMRADQDRSVTGRGEDTGASKEHTRARANTSSRAPGAAQQAHWLEAPVTLGDARATEEGSNGLAGAGCLNCRLSARERLC